MCRSSVLEILTDVVPLYDIICLRVLLFIIRRLSSESDVVRYVGLTSYGLQYGRMSSIHGKIYSSAVNDSCGIRMIC